MATFLRDEQLANLTIDEQCLSQLHAMLAERRLLMPEHAQHTENTPTTFLFSVIRFDNRGHRVFTLPELLNHYAQARYVERVILTLESNASAGSGRLVGSYMEIRFDEKAPDSCFLTVTSESNEWVNSSFFAAMEIISRFKNRNGWVRNIWSQLLIQVAGVFAGFLSSVWAAQRISPRLNVESPFFIAFLFAFLIFSNLWTYLNQFFLKLVYSVFPSIKFLRVGRTVVNWLLQNIIGGAILALLLFLLSIALSYLGRGVSGLFRFGT